MLKSGSKIRKILLASVIASATLSSALLSISYAQQSDFRGKRVVQILQEPRHRTVHQDGDVYLLDVQINPGDMTLPHLHDAAIMYTFISNGDGPLYGRVSSGIDYVEQNLTHAVSNPGPNLFRIIALTNYGPGIEDLKGDSPEGLSIDPQLENPWFRSYRLSLEPGESTALQTHHNPSVVVQVTEGKVHVSRDDGLTAELMAMGEWTWRADGSYQVTNTGSASVEVVINEARR